MALKRSLHFSKFDQWSAVNVTWKSDGNVNLGKHLSDLLWYVSCIGRKEPVAVTAKVAIFCLLSSRPLMATFFDPFDEKVHFPGETYERGVWSRLRTSFDGISLSNMILEMFFLESNFFFL